jgi:hypothetical protein
MAEGRDQLIMRPLKLIQRPYQRKFETEICMIMGFQMQCNDIRDRTLIQMLFQYHPIQVGPSTNKLKMKDSEIILMSWSPSFVLDPPIWGGLDAKSAGPWNLSSHVGLMWAFPLFKLPQSLRPSSSRVNWVGRYQHFPPIRISDYNGHWPSTLVQIAPKVM